MSTNQPQTKSSRPRMVVPDIARGIALLGIALANAPTVWFVNDRFDKANFFGGISDNGLLDPVSYTHLTLPTNTVTCRSRWSPYH